MKTFLIVIAVIAFVLWAVSKVFKKNLMSNMNPVDSITQNGTMGFQIGDSKAQTLSRIKHLKLATKEEWDNYEKRIYGDSFTTSTDIFGHIKDVSFDFSNDKLQKITVWFDKQPNEIPDFFNTVEWRIAQVIGQPTYKGKGISKWRNNISLFYDIDSPEDMMELYLFIADYI